MSSAATMIRLPNRFQIYGLGFFFGPFVLCTLALKYLRAGPIYEKDWRTIFFGQAAWIGILLLDAHYFPGGILRGVPLLINLAGAGLYESWQRRFVESSLARGVHIEPYRKILTHFLIAFPVFGIFLWVWGGWYVNGLMRDSFTPEQRRLFDLGKEKDWPKVIELGEVLCESRDFLACAWLGTAYLRADRPTEALTAANKAYANDRAQGCSVAAGALCALHRPEEALPKFKEGLEIRRRQHKQLFDRDRAQSDPDLACLRVFPIGE